MIYVITRAADDLPIGVAADQDSARAIVSEHASDGLECIIRPNDRDQRGKVPDCDVVYVAYGYRYFGTVTYAVGETCDRALRNLPVRGGFEVITLQRFTVELIA